MKRDDDGGCSDAMRNSWENALISDGLTFELVKVIPFDAEDAAFEKRDDGDPKLLARIHFSGLVDHETHLPGLDQKALASRDLSKRVGAAGFKISYTTRVQSLLTRSHQQEMSMFVASAWAIAAENYRLEDYIGLLRPTTVPTSTSASSRNCVGSA
ncbi:hypothetical protein CTA1_6626 [Colletotrichum tanaceti]|uniref:Uncharacterized protein n=1 Tax=Colletotrichum tanaceti TaxID=1306861 RepID=A0A4U6X5V8_9PEZI|nr:hypothetical protein CTA1_6626 [Colletotrichum tanaceti]